MTLLPDIAISANNTRSLTTLAFERLRQDILSGALRPEERLRIQALSERYAIGATAIREALSRQTASSRPRISGVSSSPPSRATT